jgi:hypothetical protein
LINLETYKEEAKKWRISNNLFIQEFANSIKEETKGGAKMISLSTLDKEIFFSDKTEGILFAIGKADPFVFNEEGIVGHEIDGAGLESLSKEESFEKESDEDTFIGKFCSFEIL